MAIGKGKEKNVNKQSWYEANRCQFSDFGKQCRMLGNTSMGSGSKKYCTWHYLEVMPTGNRQLTRSDFMEFVDRARVENKEAASAYFKLRKYATTNDYKEEFPGYQNINQYYQGNELLWLKINGDS